MTPFLIILARWLHLVAAAIAIGGVFFMRIILPLALQGVDPAAQREVFLRARKIFKRAIHTAILLLLLSGIYNSVRLFPEYKTHPSVLHALWGMHILVGLIVFGISLWLLAGESPPAAHKTFAAVNLVLLLILVALGSSLKTAREAYNRPGGAGPATQAAVR